MAKIKFYGVKEGKKVGVYDNWEDCKKQVTGYSDASYKKFNTYDEAKEFVYGKIIKEKRDTKNANIIKNNAIHVYTDGSYNEKDNISGYGICFIKDNKPFFKYYKGFKNHRYNSSRNVFGEIQGVLEATRIAIINGLKDIIVFYDYAGIEKWVTEEWKCKNDMTKKYVRTMKYYKNEINIQFHKVEAHTGVEFNEMADKLAKKAVGIN